MTALADIIVPVFNERDNLPQLLSCLQALPDFSAFHLIFVDNASTDDSINLLKEKFPECIPALLDALRAQDVVYASRLSGKLTAQQAGMSRLKWWGNRIISAAYNLLFKQKITDLYTGCKALKLECLQDINLSRNGFEQVLEMAAKLSAHGYHIHEIPVDFLPRNKGKSKMSHISETVKYFYWLLFYRIQLLPMLMPRRQEDVRDKRR